MPPKNCCERRKKQKLGIAKTATSLTKVVGPYRSSRIFIIFLLGRLRAHFRVTARIAEPVQAHSINARRLERALTRPSLLELLAVRQGS